MSRTLADHLSAPDVRENAFDSIRLLAAAAVIISHAFALTQGSEAGEPLFRATGGQATIGLSAVGIFFIVSGVLISLSFDRSRNWQNFARNRALRLFPGLWACLALTVLLYGPLLTELPLPAYFTDPKTLGFLGNFFFLPTSHGMGGMFPENPFPGAVNGSLWTLKYEIACYIGGSILLSLGGWRRGLVMAAWLVALGGAAMMGDPHRHHGVFYHLAQLFWLFRFYGAGMLLYLYRDAVRLHPKAGMVTALASFAAIFTPVFTEALATLGAYAILVLAFYAPRWFRALAAKGDYSYGVYIYAYPLQQAFVPVSLALGSAAFTNIALALPATFLLAWLSWHYVEAPGLRLKHATRRPSNA